MTAMDLLKLSPLHIGAAVIFVVLITYINAGVKNTLSHIPGPWYTRFTVKPSDFYMFFGRHPSWIHDLHAKYGPIVRFSPNEISISDPATAQRIHSVKNGFLKSSYYTKLVPNTSGIFNEVDPDLHRKYRRLLSGPMSETGLKTFLPRIDTKVRMAIDRIRSEQETRGVVDVAKWFMFLSFDIIGDLTFGQSFGQLDSGRKGGVVADYGNLGWASAFSTQFPFMVMLSRFLPIPIYQGAVQTVKRTFDYAQAAIDEHRTRVEQTGLDPQPTVFSKLYTAESEETWTRAQVRDNAHTFIVGGSDTTANTLIYLVWAVCKHPSVRIRLVKEIATIKEDFSYDDLKSLQYLNCVVNETLRLYSALPAGLPRRVPDGGAALKGHFVPGGATVTTQAYSLHRDEHAFLDPYRFYPERWENVTQEMKDCTLPFGGGSRTCLGKNLARIELRLTTTRFFRAFPNAIVSERDGMSDKDMVPRLYFLMVPGGHRCLIDLQGAAERSIGETELLPETKE